MWFYAEELIPGCQHYRLDFFLCEGNLPDHDLINSTLERFTKRPVSTNRDGTIGGQGWFCAVAL